MCFIFCNEIVEGDMVDDVESVDTAEETSEATALVKVYYLPVTDA